MIKKLITCVREYWRDTALTPIFMTMEVVMDCFVTLMMARLIDNGIDKGDMSAIASIGALLVLLTLIKLAFGALGGKTAANASAGFAKNLRRDMFYNLQNFSFTNIDKFSTSSLVTRLTTDVSNVQGAFQMIIRMAVRAPAMLIISLVMAMSISARLSIIFLCCIPVLGVGLYLIMSRTHPIFERVFKTYDKLNRVVQEDLRGIRVVKSFVREDYEDGKFKTISESIYQDFSKAEKQLAFNGPLMQLCMYACMLLISWFGARMIVFSGGDPVSGLSTGELMSLIIYAMQVLGSLMMLSFVFVMITISRASAERIVEVLDEKSSLHNNEKALPSVSDGSVTFDHVDFSYSGDSERLCLKDINISIASGETIGVLGGTGSGKSSLVQLIPRLYDATKGRVLVGGQDVRDVDVTALRDAVSVVLQKNVLFSGTIKENLRWGNESATDEEIKAACESAQAAEFIQAFPDGYETKLEQGGSNVSGGQKQRLCIARALLKKPKILILDDSTSAVDTHTDALIRKALRENLPGATKIIIAQRVASVMDADRILVLDNGRVVAFGTHDELMKSNPIYQEVYESQMKGGEAA